MQAFAKLYDTLDHTSDPADQRAALRRYFQQATSADAAWAIYLLGGQRLKRVLPQWLMRSWGMELASLPDWLFHECMRSVGDLAETLSLVLPDADDGTTSSLARWIEQRLFPLYEQTAVQQREGLHQAWRQLDRTGKLIWNKLLLGSFRSPVARRILLDALSEISGLNTDVIAQRLQEDWQPSASSYTALLSPERSASEIGRPYPFLGSRPLPHAPIDLGDVSQWQVEWKWDGLRVQLVRRGGKTLIWSREEQWIKDRFPELEKEAILLPEGTVLDGEVVVSKSGQVQPAADLHRRLSRKKVGPKLLQDLPVEFLAFDLLEWAGVDWRDRPLRERRRQLEEALGQLIAPGHLLLAPMLTATSWEELAAELATCRSRNALGLMLKPLDAPYQEGDAWWSWQMELHRIQAVLLYAESENGRNANWGRDVNQGRNVNQYTFAVWNGDELIPIAKTALGFSEEQLRQIDEFVQGNTVERFGPVRRVPPQWVFEIGFENIEASTRHKSGIALRSPRVLRWRLDVTPEQADSLDALRALLR